MKLHDRLRQLIPGRVVRVALLYGGVAWVVFQVVDSTYDNLNLPAFTPTLVLLLLLVQAPVALILAWASQRDERQQPVVGSVGPRDGDGPIKSVAVLPFANMSGSSEGEYLSDGIAEEIINTLVNHSDLRVTSRTSSFSFKGCQDDVRSIGGKLGVGAVLEGSVKRSGERLRVTAQLVSTADGYHLWSERYDGDLRDVFGLQEESAASVAERLVGKTGVLDPPRAELPAIEAYDAFLRGRFHWNKHTLQDYRRAVEWLTRSVEIQPDYAPAFAGLAACYFWMGFIESLPPEDVYPKAKNAAQKALQLDPSLAEAHSHLASVNMIFDWEWESAERGFRKAIELDPQSSIARQAYCVFLVNVGRVWEGLEENAACLKVDPLWPKAHQDRGYLLLLSGQVAESAAQYERALQLDPASPLTQLGLGWPYLQMGEYDEALKVMRASVAQAGGGPLFRACLAAGLAYSSQKDEAIALLAELEAESTESYVPPVLLSWIHIALGDFDKAFLLLEKAFAERSAMLLSAPSFIYWDPVRDDPRFASLLDGMGLSAVVQHPRRDLLKSPFV